MSTSEDWVGFSIKLAAQIKSRRGEKAVVMLERIARGGGATNWFVCNTADDVRYVFRAVRAGSLVSCYLDGQLTVETFERLTLASVLRLIEENSETVVGLKSSLNPEVEMELLHSPGELEEWAASINVGDVVMYGLYPGRDNDGIHAVTLVVPDSDGIVRKHPY